MSTVTVTTPDALAAAVAAALAGDTILMVPNVYVLTKGIDLNKPGLTLAQVDGAPTGSAVIQFTGAHDYSEALKVSANGVTVRDVSVKGIGCRDVNVGRSSGVKFIGVHFVGDLYGFDADSVDGLLLQGCTNTRKSGYVYYVHGNQSTGTRSGTVTVIGCQGGGSDGQHNFRVNSCDKITFTRCAFDFAPQSSNGKLAPGISIRAGVGEAVIDDVDTYGLGLGPEIHPGADAPGSTVLKVTVTNTRVKGGWVALWPGLQQAFISGLTVNADRSGSSIGVGDGITGELAGITSTYVNGALFNRATMPPGLKLTGPITHNGKPYPPAIVTPPTPAQLCVSLRSHVDAAGLAMLDQLAAALNK